MIERVERVACPGLHSPGLGGCLGGGGGGGGGRTLVLRDREAGKGSLSQAVRPGAGWLCGWWLEEEDSGAP